VSIGALFDPKLVEDKAWDHPRMRHDAEIVVTRANSRNRHGVIALPMESSPFGEPLPVHPKNMCQIQLPLDQFESFKTMVYSSGGDNFAQEVFRRSWRALHTLGYADAVIIPAHEVKARKKAEGAEKSPDEMTQKEYEEWRTGGKKKKFVPAWKFTR
jgi:hypothetical protein